MTRRKSKNVISKESESIVEEMPEVSAPEIENDSEEIPIAGDEDGTSTSKNNDVLLPRSASRYVKPLR